ncbi:hypothetical protein ACFPER_09925 [Agromyces aurantiacus]|uniref:Uncharacterized protein n=1 Tax=Agromyces aurantiacus TaxID=165814 RepID=A0ABV9R740_9MICO|nr:hypothetical protein [Agromyces aurantiacus]MBM7503792.1 hypothetical protein [Agromyces aurantiacus]
MRPPASTRAIRLARSATVAALLTAALGACAGPGTPAATPADPETALKTELAALPGVDSVEIGGMEPRDENPRYTTVTIAADAEEDDVLATAEQVPAIAADLDWADPITLTAVAPEPEPGTGGGIDGIVEPWWSFEVTPETDAATARATVAGLLDAAAVPGVVGLAFIDGWPYAALLEPDRVADRFDALMATPLFAQGGSFALRSEQPMLRFTHLEGLISRNLIEAVIAIAAEHPHAEVLLEGPDWPKLYIARVSTAEAEAIAARLADPALLDGADEAPAPLGWQITSLDTDGPGYWEGEVGRP